jgi:hypothetical protein
LQTVCNFSYILAKIRLSTDVTNSQMRNFAQVSRAVPCGRGNRKTQRRYKRAFAKVLQKVLQNCLLNIPSSCLETPDNTTDNFLNVVLRVRVYVCVCVRVCMCACVRVCVFARMSVRAAFTRITVEIYPHALRTNRIISKQAGHKGHPLLQTATEHGCMILTKQPAFFSALKRSTVR